MQSTTFVLSPHVGLFDACQMYESLCNICIVSASLVGEVVTIQYYEYIGGVTNTDVSYSCIHAADDEQ